MGAFHSCPPAYVVGEMKNTSAGGSLAAGAAGFVGKRNHAERFE
jgi:hypothetical protein